MVHQLPSSPCHVPCSLMAGSCTSTASCILSRLAALLAGNNSCLFTQLCGGPAAQTLTQLRLPAVVSSKYGLASLSALTALQSLDLHCGQIPMLSDLDVALAGMAHLTCLDLSQLAFLLDGPLAQLSRLTELRCVAQEACTPAWAALHGPVGHPDAPPAPLSPASGALYRFLSLESHRGRPNTSVSAGKLAGLSRLQLLEHLNLGGCPVSDAHLLQIACCTGLRRLLLESAPVSDQGLLALSGLSVLNVLHLDRRAGCVPHTLHTCGMPAHTQVPTC